MSLSRPLPRTELGVRGVSGVEVTAVLSILVLSVMYMHALLQSSPSLTDFWRLKTIGSGTFGRVLLVQNRRSMKYYALKVLEKANVCATLIHHLVLIVTNLYR